jgi:hypothetical protein
MFLNIEYNKKTFLNNDIINSIIILINDALTLISIIRTSKIFHQSLLAVTKVFVNKNTCSLRQFDYLTLFKYCPNVISFSLNSFIFDKIDGIMYEIFNNCKISEFKIINCQFTNFAKTRFEYYISSIATNNKLSKLQIISCGESWHYIVKYNINFKYVYFEDLVFDDPITYVEYCLMNDNICYLICNKIEMSNFDDDECGELLLEQRLNANYFYNKNFNNQSLKYINLSRCKQETLNFSYIMELLSNAKQLLYIDFSYNEITSDYENMCCTALSKFSKLKMLDLRHNPISQLQINLWQKVNPNIRILF